MAPANSDTQMSAGKQSQHTESPTHWKYMEGRVKWWLGKQNMKISLDLKETFSLLPYFSFTIKHLILLVATEQEHNIRNTCAIWHTDNPNK